MPTDTSAPAEVVQGFWAGLDHVANFINALDTSEMTGREVRSAIYAECLSARPMPLAADALDGGSLALREALTNALFALEYWERESRVWLSAREKHARPGWMRGTRERGQYEIARGKAALSCGKTVGADQSNTSLERVKETGKCEHEGADSNLQKAQIASGVGPLGVGGEGLE